MIFFVLYTIKIITLQHEKYIFYTMKKRYTRWSFFYTLKIIVYLMKTFSIQVMNKFSLYAMENIFLHDNFLHEKYFSTSRKKVCSSRWFFTHWKIFYIVMILFYIIKSMSSPLIYEKESVHNKNIFSVLWKIFFIHDENYFFKRWKAFSQFRKYFSTG